MIKINKKIISARLKELRISHGYTQKNIAELLGIKNYSTVGSWEIGKSEPSLSMFAKLCEIYRITDIEEVFPSLNNSSANKPNSNINNLKETQLIEYYRDSEPAIQDAAFNMLKDSAKKAKNDELKQKRAT